jgi:hypothetical protein
VPLGAQGVPGILFNEFWLHFLKISRWFLVDVGSYRSDILGIFSIMRYRSLRRFPVPLVWNQPIWKQSFTVPLRSAPKLLARRSGRSPPGY